MEIAELDLREYCGLNRPRFRFDPESDAEWYFGNREVSEEILSRVSNDFLIRGVPKCGVLGRFGQGKTHTIHHLKYLFEKKPHEYPAIPFVMRIAPYDESSDMGGWSYIHGKMLDAMGEAFIRDLVRSFDKMPDARSQALHEGLAEVFTFGPENLQQSLASVLAAYFLREGRPTMPAWNWLRGQKPSGKELPESGVNMMLDHAGDMINVVLNLGLLSSKTSELGICFLMDEGQALDDIDKRDVEIHDAFLQMADDENANVGFVLTIFGTGQSAIPKVIASPDDILSRIGVTGANFYEAFIDLKRVIDSQEDMSKFMLDFLAHIKDIERAKEIVDQFSLHDKTNAELLPFEEPALKRVEAILYQAEPLRNPRMIIERLSILSAECYQRAKQEGAYVTVDVSLVNNVLSDL